MNFNDVIKKARECNSSLIEAYLNLNDLQLILGYASIAVDDDNMDDMTVDLISELHILSHKMDNIIEKINEIKG